MRRTEALRALRAMAITGLLCAPTAGAAGTVEGTVALAIGGQDLSAAAPVVAFLEPLDGTPVKEATETAVIHQAGARFAPAFIVVSAGQRVELRNDDSIFHNVFSFSPPRPFDLGTYPKGESRFVSFDRPGLVRLFCSIHESMNGAVFVAPSAHHTLVAPTGAFALNGVADGRYRLGVWSPVLPQVERELDVAGGVARVEIQITPAEPDGVAED